MNQNYDNQEVMDAPQRVEVAVIEASTRAEIDMQVSTAKRYPRDVVRAESRMKSMVGRSPETASLCFYSIPRKEKNIEGPSIRMAEIVAINYGNMRVMTRTPIVGETTVTVEWAAHDLESNYSTSGSVSNKILDRNGKRYNEDMINMNCLSVTSKARRNGIFAIVPGTMVDALMEEAYRVAAGGDRPIEAKREAAMRFFRNQGISEERILKALHCESIEQIDNAKIITLKGIATAIRDEQTTLDLAFPQVEIKDTDGHRMSMGKKKDKVEATPDTEPTKDAKKEPERPELLPSLKTLISQFCELESCTSEEANDAMAAHARAILKKSLNELVEKDVKQLASEMEAGNIRTV